MYKSYDQLGEAPPQNKDQHNVIEIQNRNQLEELLNSHRVVVVDIFADWCGPCKLTAPSYSILADKYNKPKQVILVKFRFENIEMPERRTITGIPLFEFYLDGKKVEKVIGGNIEEVEDKLKSILEKVNFQTVQDFTRSQQGGQYTRNSIRNNRNTIPDVYVPPAPGGNTRANQYGQY